MNSKSIITSILLFLLATLVHAQELPDENLNGKNLRIWLKENWYEGYHWEETNDRFNNPIYADLYRNARREMYNYIDNEDNQLVDVYGGLQVDFEAGGISTDAYPLNCEHTVPQSFFRPAGEDNSSEPMRSDIHHLFPAYDAWNSTRSNYPFDEIEDSRATKWMYQDNSYTVPPSEDIDSYSEFTDQGSNRFEPREDHKGNVARAILYFYTMYEDNELVYRPIEDVADINVMVSWHEADPVDDAEKARNLAIAEYQGNQNPFVTHPELLERAWAVVTDVETGKISGVNLFPNPASHLLTLSLNTEYLNSIIKIMDISGHTIHSETLSDKTSTVDISQLTDGLYFLLLINQNSNERFKFKKISN